MSIARRFSTIFLALLAVFAVVGPSHAQVASGNAFTITGVDVDWQIQGTYQPRDYCTQYRETDFAFASRLMEQEGIFYYFKHAADGRKNQGEHTGKQRPPFFDFTRLRP